MPTTCRNALRAYSRRLRVGLIAVAVLVLLCRRVPGATLYESGTLGPTGLPSGAVGQNISADVYSGVRFELTQPVITSQIGGHFVALSGGTLFGAIVALDGPTDFPNSNNLSSADVLGATTLAFPTTSMETLGDLALPLSPGWYALVFGSGLFNTEGRGVAIQNGMDIGDPSYIGYLPRSGVIWLALDGAVANNRFLLLGSIVAEPTALSVGTVGAMLLAACALRSSRR